MGNSIDEKQANFDIGIRGHEIDNQWHDMQATENDGRRDDDLSPGSGIFTPNSTFGIVDLLKDASTRCDIGTPCFGQFSVPCRSVEQAAAESCFQSAHFPMLS